MLSGEKDFFQSQMRQLVQSKSRLKPIAFVGTQLKDLNWLSIKIIIDDGFGISLYR